MTELPPGAWRERSAALYERLGFVHMDVLELPEGGPPLWLMRRPPPGASWAEAGRLTQVMRCMA